MRPWAHESELARFLDVQRSMSRARTPSTPTFANSNVIGMAPDDDIRRVDEMRTALHNLKARLAHSEEMADHVSTVFDFLSDLRADFPIPAPERAFTRLQPLRDLIFWLPPGVLRAGESDLTALTMLAHLYATALVVEGLFPEIGASYLGVMCLAPLERIHEILQSRRATQPADSGCQMALQIVEFPMRVMSSYKARQRQSSASALTDPYGRSTHSPHHSPFMSGAPTTHHLGLGSTTSGGSPGEHSGSAVLYGGSPVQTPSNMSASAPGSYYGTGTTGGGGGRRGGSPGGMSAPGMNERSASMTLLYGGGTGTPQQQQPGQQVRSSHDTNPDRMGYFSAVLPSSTTAVGGYQAQLHHHQQQQHQAYHGQQHGQHDQQEGGYYAGGGMGASVHHVNNRFVAPSQLYA